MCVILLITNYLVITKLVIKVNIQKLVQVTASCPSDKVWGFSTSISVIQHLILGAGAAKYTRYLWKDHAEFITKAL